MAEGRMIPSAAAMRSQVAVELPQVNQQLEAHDTVLSLPQSTPAGAQRRGQR